MAAKNFTPPKNSKKVTPDIAQLEQQKRKAYLEKDKVKLEEVNEKLEYIYWGKIKK